MNQVDHEIQAAGAIDRLGRSGRPEEAYSMALQAIRDGRADDELLYIAADLAWRLKDTGRAYRLVKALLERDSDHLNGWILFGRICEEKGDEVRVRHARSVAQGLFPALREVLSEEETIAGEAGPGEMAADSEPVDREISFDTMTFAEICMRQGYYNKALKIYYDLLQKNPHDPELKRRIEEVTRRLDGNDRSEN